MVGWKWGSPALQSGATRKTSYHRDMAAEIIVGYCRVSTLEQKKHGYGIAIQKRVIRRYAKTRDWELKRFYTDEAKSGADDERAALDQLRLDCQQGQIGGVIFASLDRLARSVRHEENLIYEFEQRGVEIYMADTPNYNGNNRKDVLMRQIRAAIDEENRKDIIDRLYRGRQERARKGYPSGGNVPYGYRRYGGRWRPSKKRGADCQNHFPYAC